MRGRTDLSDTTLILVRHAVHGLLGRVLAGCMPGVGLSAEGHAQAAALADALAGQVIRAVWTSPLQRAIETAVPIAARHGLMPVIDPALTEVDFGTWTGQPFDALHGPEWEAWNTNRAMAVPPGGETILAAQARAVAVTPGGGGRYRCAGQPSRRAEGDAGARAGHAAGFDAPFRLGTGVAQPGDDGDRVGAGRWFERTLSITAAAAIYRLGCRFHDAGRAAAAGAVSGQPTFAAGPRDRFG